MTDAERLAEIRQRRDDAPIRYSQGTALVPMVNFQWIDVDFLFQHIDRLTQSLNVKESCMTSTQITGGSVKYTVPSNYNSGRDGCEVTIHFTVGEGDGGLAANMGDAARNEALRLATGADRPYEKPSTFTPAAVQFPTAAERKEEAIEARAGGPVVPPTPAPPAAQPPVGVVEPSVIVAPTVVASSPPGSIVTGSIPAAAEAPPTVTASVITAETIVGASTAPASEIDDAELRKAVEDKLKELERAAHGDENLARLGPVKVGQCLADFVPPPAKVYSLSQEQRPAFLAALAKVS